MHNRKLSNHIIADNREDSLEGEDTISDLGGIGNENFNYDDEESDGEQEVAGSSTGDAIDSPQHPYLYDGFSVTSHCACLLIKSFVYRHQLTDLLKLFQLVLPKPNTLPPSFYLLHKGENMADEIVHHYYCNQCFTIISNPQSTYTCTNASCHARFQRDLTNFFIELNIEQQLKTILSCIRY